MARRTVVAVLIACGGRSQLPSDGAIRATTGAHVAVGDSGTADSLAATPAVAPAPVQPGADFVAETRVLYRIAACAGDAAIPAALQPAVDRHCHSITPYLETFRAKYLGDARAWFIAREPKDLPHTVVYPFGGGDLISALVPFP